MRWIALLAALVVVVSPLTTIAQTHSVARQWNEELLDAIRVDFARPTVHARNLFHTSVAMWDAWAAFDNQANTFLLGRTVGGYRCPFYGISKPSDIKAAREEAISYACYRLMTHRFGDPSPGAVRSHARFDSLMNHLGYDMSVASTDYSTGSPAALGNYIAAHLIAFGLQDGSNEQGDGGVGPYGNLYYQPVNPPLIVELAGNPDIVDFNRWQPLTLEIFIDQGGNVIPGATPEFLSPEWGIVTPFSLSPMDLTKYVRGNFEAWVYHDPGDPPLLDTLQTGGLSEEYKWGNALVAVWSGQLDPSDGVMWDISPGASGNNQDPLPTDFPSYRNYYDMINGGASGEIGHAVNPYTNQPYPPNIVARGDYARVLAEFWADGPESETPPGHWFTILNYVNDHPVFEKRFKGTGPVLDDLEWDVKAYLLMGGTMHDVAITAWGIKGWYDYIRPVCAIRGMCDRGQSTDNNGNSFDPGGIHLVPGFIDTVGVGDPLAGAFNQHVGKIKLYAWRGPDFVLDPDTDVAGVDWILAENWWPYQRPSFITPPFAGYVSGHSTYSRAAAIIMELMTGDAYFPAGVGEFVAPMNEFLVFEDGPSDTVVLQWATYKDASDQTSLSRIWGGIHPPADDIPGRIIGEEIGTESFAFAERYFNGQAYQTTQIPKPTVYPNPVGIGSFLTVELDQPTPSVKIQLFDVQGRKILDETRDLNVNQQFLSVEVDGLKSGIYFLRVRGDGFQTNHKIAIVR